MLNGGFDAGPVILLLERVTQRKPCRRHVVLALLALVVLLRPRVTRAQSAPSIVIVRWQSLAMVASVVKSLTAEVRHGLVTSIVTRHWIDRLQLVWLPRVHDRLHLGLAVVFGELAAVSVTVTVPERVLSVGWLAECRAFEGSFRICQELLLLLEQLLILVRGESEVPHCPIAVLARSIGRWVCFLCTVMLLARATFIHLGELRHHLGCTARLLHSLLSLHLLIQVHICGRRCLVLGMHLS